MMRFGRGIKHYKTLQGAGNDIDPELGSRSKPVSLSAEK